MEGTIIASTHLSDAQLVLILAGFGLVGHQSTTAMVRVLLTAEAPGSWSGAAFPGER